MAHWELLLLFFTIAFIYSSVGFGGGSGYLALLALYELPFKEIRLIALLCNIIVVAGGTYIYFKRKQVNLNKILPLVLLSVPLAYIGAILRISEQTFFIVLGCSLIVAGILLWVKVHNISTENNSGSVNIPRDSALGGSIGCLAGLVGIGGGIFLSPVLNLLKWDTPKRIAATASIFILVNSIAGVSGQLTHIGEVSFLRILLLCIAVFIGGQLGSRTGAVKFSPLVIRRVTAILVLAAGINVLYRYLPAFN